MPLRGDRTRTVIKECPEGDCSMRWRASTFERNVQKWNTFLSVPFFFFFSLAFFSCDNAQ